MVSDYWNRVTIIRSAVEDRRNLVPSNDGSCNPGGNSTDHHISNREQGDMAFDL